MTDQRMTKIWFRGKGRFKLFDLIKFVLFERNLIIDDLENGQRLLIWCRNGQVSVEIDQIIVN